MNDQEILLEKIYERPSTLIDVKEHYCPGCGHGVVHKLLMEAVQELGIQEDTIGIAPVGCSVFAYNYLDIDMQEAAHGRATAVATGIRRLLPDKYIFTYQGDGDFAAIGTGESIHAANRGENFLVVFINNAIYGMTTGQMAPTSLLNMITTTTPFGRNVERNGYPFKITDVIATLPGAYYVTRHAVNNPNNVRKLKKAILTAFKYQKEKKGFCLIEVLSNCPSNWKMTPVESNEWLEKNMMPVYPLGDLKIPPKEGEK
jgi:2-oxoglutarate/2-oxoacid ferredoxin oxidoreductase subunit beta